MYSSECTYIYYSIIWTINICCECDCELWSRFFLRTTPFFALHIHIRTPQKKVRMWMWTAGVNALAYPLFFWISPRRLRNKLGENLQKISISILQFLFFPFLSSLSLLPFCRIYCGIFLKYISWGNKSAQPNGCKSFKKKLQIPQGSVFPHYISQATPVFLSVLVRARQKRKWWPLMIFSIAFLGKNGQKGQLTHFKLTTDWMFTLLNLIKNHDCIT